MWIEKTAELTRFLLTRLIVQLMWVLWKRWIQHQHKPSVIKSIQISQYSQKNQRQANECRILWPRKWKCQCWSLSTGCKVVLSTHLNFHLTLVPWKDQREGAGWWEGPEPQEKPGIFHLDELPGSLEHKDWEEICWGEWRKKKKEVEYPQKLNILIISSFLWNKRQKKLPILEYLYSPRVTILHSAFKISITIQYFTKHLKKTLEAHRKCV